MVGEFGIRFWQVEELKSHSRHNPWLLWIFCSTLFCHQKAIYFDHFELKETCLITSNVYWGFHVANTVSNYTHIESNHYHVLTKQDLQKIFVKFPPTPEFLRSFLFVEEWGFQDPKSSPSLNALRSLGLGTITCQIHGEKAKCKSWILIDYAATADSWHLLTIFSQTFPLATVLKHIFQLYWHLILSLFLGIFRSVLCEAFSLNTLQFFFACWHLGFVPPTRTTSPQNTTARTTEICWR